MTELLFGVGYNVGGLRETGGVITIYLDQMKWIDLARVESGHPRGVQFVEHLAAFRRAVDSGAMRFPLSIAHYYETGKQRDPTRRTQLAATMMELSRSLRIAPPHTIVPWEAYRAVAEILELPLSIANIRLFGDGAAHAFSSPTLRYSAPESYRGIELSRDIRATLQDSVGQSLEEALLSSTVPEGMPDTLRIVLENFKTLTDEKFVRGQNFVASELEKLGRHRIDDVMLGTAIADIMSPLDDATRYLNVSLPADILDNGQMLDLVEHMPSRWVEMKLRGLRQANPQKPWHGNDLNDVTALAIAVPYCDVVGLFANEGVAD